MEVNGTIFLQIFIFLTLLLWLSRSLFAPILRLFDERDRRIVGAKEQALTLNSLAEEKANAFDIAYENARTTLKSTLSELRRNMDKEHLDALAHIKAVAQEKLKKAQDDLVEQEKEIRQKLVGASVGIADDIVNSFLHKSA